MTQISTLVETVGLVEVHDDAGAILAVLPQTVEIVQIVTPELTGPQGPPGPVGDPGVQGVQGEQGPFAPTFEMRFANPSTEWIFQHNLNLYPVVNLYDPDGNEIGGDISMPDKNTVVVDFFVPIAGTIILKA